MKALIIIVSFISFTTFGQTNPEQVYEQARYEIVANNKSAHVCKITQKAHLTSDQMIDIEERYLLKEGVFKVNFTDENENGIVEVYFFEPVDYGTIEELAGIFFTEFLVSKPLEVDIIKGNLVYSNNESE